MTSRIVHSYFFRFRLIRREIRHFVFSIGSYETPWPQRHLFNKTVETDRSAICLRVAANTRTKPTDRSAISLRVAAKTRTKPTGAPSTVYRTNMPLTMAYCRFDSIYSSSLREINPYTALMADMHIDGIDAYHYAARNKR